MEKGFNLESILGEYLQTDNDFDEYVDGRCISIVSNCNEYLDKEHSGKYSEEELSMMRERLIYKASWVSALRFAFNYNKL